MILGLILKFFGGGIVGTIVRRVTGYLRQKSSDNVELAKAADHLEENHEDVVAAVTEAGIRADAAAYRSRNWIVSTGAGLHFWVFNIAWAMMALPAAGWWGWEVYVNWTALAALPPIPANLLHLLIIGASHAAISHAASKILK